MKSPQTAVGFPRLRSAASRACSCRVRRSPANGVCTWVTTSASGRPSMATVAMMLGDPPAGSRSTRRSSEFGLSHGGAEERFSPLQRSPGEVDDDAARSSPRQFVVNGLLGWCQRAVPQRAPLAAIQARRGIASWLEASPADGRDAPPPLGFGEHVLGLARTARAVAANPASAASASCCHSTHCSRVRRRRR